ncbi:MAG: L,D-transpeptidase family protein [Microbacteriaceae bacterium]
MRKTSSALVESKRPARRKRHLGLWLGIPGGVIVAVAGVACSVLLIAPGVSAAGVDVGWSTATAASDAISAHLAGTQISVRVGSDEISVKGADLGLAVDAAATAETAHSDRPLWNIGAWNSGAVPVYVTVDAHKALASLRSAAPKVFVEPENAGIHYDSRAIAYTVVDGKDGAGLDFDALASNISDALSKGDGRVAVTAQLKDVAPPVTTAEAKAKADSLNTLLANAGFYIGDEKVVGLDAAQVASWITVGVTDDGIKVSADAAAIEAVMPTLPAKVNREVVNEVVVTNSAGAHLHTIQEGHDGWTLLPTAGIAGTFAAQIATGDGAFKLPVTIVKAATTELHRTIEVDKGAGQTILYENGQVVATYPVAIGKSDTPTDEGHFTVYGQLRIQDMGCVTGYDYCTKDVPWVTYFNGDEGFHGTYWHNNFGAGAMMSHGCVNMRIPDAEQLYRFAQVGTEVWVHA